MSSEKVTVATSKDEGSNIKFIRRVIVGIILAIAVSFGLPLFFSTTTIYRAELPINQINDKVVNFGNEVSFRIPVYLDLPNSLEHFIPTAQNYIDDKLRSRFPQLDNIWSLELKRINSNVREERDYIVKFEYIEPPTGEDESLPTESFYISPFSKTSVLTLTDAVVNAKKVDDFLSVILLDQVFKEEIEQINRLINEESKTSTSKDVVLPYSPKYNIVFSLLTEEGKSISWDIEKSSELLKPIFKKLAPFANFTISSQIQYYSTLTNSPIYDENENAFIIPEEDLSTFINHGDWNLITHDINPTINFIVYFGQSNYDHKPLLVDKSKTNSFLIPQWGGVNVFNKEYTEGHSINIDENDLIPIMETFTSQLFELLGIVKNPKSPSIRFDSLSRISAYKNLKKSLENLSSLVKLTESLNEISIPKLTKEHVLQTLQYFDNSVKALIEQQFELAMTYSSKSILSSDKAFFEKEMVQQAYFPSEHKLAVFLPLLGPVSSIIIIGLIKLVKDIKANN